MGSRNVSKLIKQLFEVSSQLEAEIPDRNFLPSGQQLGNLGEILVAEAFGLNLCKAMTKGIDAHTEDGRMVQIKTVTSRAAGVHLSKRQCAIEEGNRWHGPAVTEADGSGFQQIAMGR